MVIISDTTALIALAKIDSLELLKKLWQVIFIPLGVKEEVLEEKPGGKKIHQAIEEGWIIVREIKEIDYLKVLQNHLGFGEAECIALAVEQKASLIITDDKKAKNYAKRIGINVIGTLGLIVQAVNERVLTPEEGIKTIERLKEINFRLNDTVIAQAISRINKH